MKPDKWLYWLPVITLMLTSMWFFLIFSGQWHELWLTNDQRAYQLYEQGQFLEAAKVFDNPSFKGSAYFKAGEFKKSASVFSTMNNATSRFNQANALLMMGKYEKAIDMYNLTIKLSPHFNGAHENKAIAIARKHQMDKSRDNDEGTGGKLEADEVVYDNKNKRGQDSVEQSEHQQSNVGQWLDRLQTGPKDFLKYKFGYQYAQQQSQSQRVNKP